MNQCPRCLKLLGPVSHIHTCTPTVAYGLLEAEVESLTAEALRMRAFIRTLLDPEVHGHTMTKEIRNAARSALGMEVVK